MNYPISRPFGVTTLGGLFAFGVLASGLAAVSLLDPAGPLEPIWRLNPRGRLAFSHMGLWAPLLLGVVCMACAASAYGFLAGRRWGYRMGVGLLIVNGTGDLINAALGIEPRAAVGVPIVGLLLWYLSSRKVRAFFLAPLPRRSSALAHLMAAGRLVPTRLDLSRLGKPHDRPREMSISEALEEQRRDD